MDWGLIFQVTLAVLGAALMVGGIVAYRGSARTGVRSFAAAGIASGVVMLAIVVMTVPAYSTSDGPRGPVIDLTDGSPPPGSISGVGPGISIGEAFTSNLTEPLESTDSSSGIRVVELAIALGVIVLTVALVVGGVVVYRRTNEAVERRAGAVAVAGGLLILVTIVLAGVVPAAASVMLPLVFIELGLLGAAFWLWMLIDCAINEPNGGNDKLIWVLIILFLQVLGAALYLLARRPQRLALARS